MDDEDVKSYFTMVGHIWRWFEEIRCVLRVSREFSGKKQNNLPTNAVKLKRDTVEAIKEIRGERRKIGGDLDFVALVEDEFDDVTDADIGMWMFNFIDTDAKMAT